MYFTVENTGKELLVIDDVNTSCGCTTVGVFERTGSVGKTIDITVVYKAEYESILTRRLLSTVTRLFHPCN